VIVDDQNHDDANNIERREWGIIIKEGIRSHQYLHQE